MDFGLQGKTAMVAAGSKGIGLAAAEALIAEGCRVSICSRSQENLDQALKHLGENAIGFVCDVSSESDLEAWMRATTEQIGPADIVVTNTGGPPAGFVHQVTDEQWQSGVDSTLMPAVRLARLAAPHMQAAGWGRIIHVTSLVALQVEPILAISSTIRAGMIALTRLQAKEFAAHGITVNSVLPGHTMTDRQVHLAELRADREEKSVSEVLDETAAKIPAGRLGTSREIAAAIAFLASAPASYVNGVSLVVDGAMTSAL